MKVEQSFAREIRKVANGDGTRRAKFAFLRTVRSCKRALSTPEVIRTFDGSFREFGRVPVAICIAASLVAREDRIDGGSYQWGLSVLSLWTNAPSDKLEAAIDDGLHPTRIEEYAGDFIRLVSE